MKNSFLRSSVTLLLTLALSAFAIAKPSPTWEHLQPEREQVIASLNIVELLKRHHYNKPPLDKARSAKIYAAYLEMLDPARIYFSQEDLAEFQGLKHSFAKVLKAGDLEPGFALYRRQISRQHQYLEYALGTLEKGVSTIDFTLKESFETDREKADWPKNERQLKELWRKRLKDEVLRLKLAGKDEQGIQELLLKRYRNQQNRLQQIRSEDVFQTYINAFAQTYDPHTSYLSPESAENFDINMSLSLEGIGAVLQSDNEFVKVVRIVPASPAEKSRQLAPADRIVAVGQNKGEMVDVIGWRLDEVVKLIRGPKGSKVRLEVIPASNAPNDQSSKIVTIIRDAVKLEEQAAKKSILELEHNGHSTKIGIIEIPTFYLDFKAYRAGDPNYKSTTRDVRALLAELSDEKVDGIVIDLRNNGGGSLQEATELSSLFIEQGPTVLVRSSNGQVDVLADDKKGAFYRGPLTVLVNRLSASASEIFAGAMQDYHRALVIGGQTFGKGTVQSIQPLNHGELKLTLAKFYRVSGQSTQHQGVIPDISYPADVDVEQIGESALDEALPWDSIAPAIRPITNQFQPYLGELNSLHEQRTDNDPDFVYKRQRLKLTQELMQQSKVSLNEKDRKKQHAQAENKQLQLENTLRLAKGKPPLNSLKSEEEQEQELLDNQDKKDKKPEDDAYLVETARIMLDWMNLRATLAHK